MKARYIYQCLKENISPSLRRGLLMILLIFSIFSLKSQEPIDGTTTREILAVIEEASAAWNRIELNGKIKSPMLPVSPSVKIYMEKDVRIDISVRAPFLGEVLRIQATNDTIIGINKFKKTYWSESIGSLNQKYGGTLELIQSVLLGRMVILGQGPVNSEAAEIVNIFPDGEDGWLLMPIPAYQPSEARYGYVAGAEGEALALIVELPDSEDYLEVDYDWKKNGKYDLDLQLAIKGKEYEGRMELDTPKLDPLPMNPVAVDSRYRKVTFKEFITKII